MYIHEHYSILLLHTYKPLLLFIFFDATFGLARLFHIFLYGLTSDTADWPLSFESQKQLQLGSGNTARMNHSARTPNAANAGQAKCGSIAWTSQTQAN